jgi:hypothetical protein
MKDESGKSVSPSRGHHCPYGNQVELTDRKTRAQTVAPCGVEGKFCQLCLQDMDDEGATIGVALDDVGLGF